MKNSKFFDLLVNGRYGRRVALVIIDTACFAAVDLFYYFVALLAENSMPVNMGSTFLANSLLQLGLIFLFRGFFGTYRNVWRYSNTKAYFNVVFADACAGLATLAIARTVQIYVPGFYYGLWHAATVGAMTALLTLVSRFCYSLIYKAHSKGKNKKARVPVAIVGAGRLGSYLAGDLKNNPNSGFEPMFFVDVDGAKIGNTIGGLRVCDAKTAPQMIDKIGIREVIIAIASKDSEELSDLYYYYRNLGCNVRVYDSLVSNSREQKGVLRDFSIEDLLFRKTMDVSSEAALGFYSGKTVLVTGGGGSIGSELCRQIAKCAPKELVIFDIYENNAYEIQQELLRTYGERLKLSVEIGSVRDVERVEQLFATYRPELIFHAAAHKHVPLMESCGAEAIKNNCLGTYNVANAAEKFGAQKFVLISTDKAVNPTNIMGASKRICEMIIQCRTDSKTSFCAVRFGNVLGSNGSVIPLFKRQIAEGGPVTITDKRIIRYFMTIPEASQLVVLAGAMAKKGELFVLDMGKPVRIYDLAMNMIQLSGLEPNVDIEIKEIGLRPGEKLYEELLMKTEQMDKTENNMIFIERDAPHTRQEVEEKLLVLKRAIEEGTSMRDAVAAVVPTYHVPDEVNKNAENSEEMKLAGCTS